MSEAKGTTDPTEELTLEGVARNLMKLHVKATNAELKLEDAIETSKYLSSRIDALEEDGGAKATTDQPTAPDTECGETAPPSPWLIGMCDQFEALTLEERKAMEREEPFRYATLTSAKRAVEHHYESTAPDPGNGDAPKPVADYKTPELQKALATASKSEAQEIGELVESITTACPNGIRLVLGYHPDGEPEPYYTSLEGGMGGRKIMYAEATATALIGALRSTSHKMQYEGEASRWSTT